MFEFGVDNKPIVAPLWFRTWDVVRQLKNVSEDEAVVLLRSALAYAYRRGYADGALSGADDVVFNARAFDTVPTEDELFGAYNELYQALVVESRIDDEELVGRLEADELAYPILCGYDSYWNETT